jgi:hypothetical protein
VALLSIVETLEIGESTGNEIDRYFDVIKSLKILREVLLMSGNSIPTNFKGNFSAIFLRNFNLTANDLILGLEEIRSSLLKFEYEPETCKSV